MASPYKEKFSGSGSVVLFIAKNLFKKNSTHVPDFKDSSLMKNIELRAPIVIENNVSSHRKSVPK